MQNCAARLILGCCKYDHSAPLLRDLHWLPIEPPFTFKLLLITLTALKNLVAPCYIYDFLHLFTTNRRLRSSSSFQLSSSFVKSKNFWRPSILYVYPQAVTWNCLPTVMLILVPVFSSSVTTFKSSLKTFLFEQCFI